MFHAYGVLDDVFCPLETERQCGRPYCVFKHKKTATVCRTPTESVVEVASSSGNSSASNKILDKINKYEQELKLLKDELFKQSSSSPSSAKPAEEGGLSLEYTPTPKTLLTDRRQPAVSNEPMGLPTNDGKLVNYAEAVFSSDEETDDGTLYGCSKFVPKKADLAKEVDQAKSGLPPSSSSDKPIPSVRCRVLPSSGSGAGQLKGRSTPDLLTKPMKLTPTLFDTGSNAISSSASSATSTKATSTKATSTKAVSTNAVSTNAVSTKAASTKAASTVASSLSGETARSAGKRSSSSGRLPLPPKRSKESSNSFQMDVEFDGDDGPSKCSNQTAASLETAQVSVDVAAAEKQPKQKKSPKKVVLSDAFDQAFASKKSTKSRSLTKLAKSKNKLITAQTVSLSSSSTLPPASSSSSSSPLPSRSAVPPKTGAKSTEPSPPDRDTNALAQRITHSTNVPASTEQPAERRPVPARLNTSVWSSCVQQMQDRFRRIEEAQVSTVLTEPVGMVAATKKRTGVASSSTAPTTCVLSTSGQQFNARRENVYAKPARTAHQPSAQVQSTAGRAKIDLKVRCSNGLAPAVRQKQLNRIVDEYRISSASQGSNDQLVELAVQQESDICRRATTKSIYFNLVSGLIKKIRDSKPDQLADTTTNSAGPSGSVSSPNGAGPSRVLHHDKRGSFSVLRRSGLAKYRDVDQLPDSLLYEFLKSYLASEEQLVDNGFPRLAIDEEGQPVAGGIVTIKPTGMNRKAGQPAHSSRTEQKSCIRCGTTFTAYGDAQVIRSRQGQQPDNSDLSNVCVYHWGKAFKQRVEGRNFEHVYSCCQERLNSKGCQVSNYHVHEDNKLSDVTGYLTTTSSTPSALDDYGVFALDCEMVYTTRGNELGRVTLVDRRGQTVFESLVRPFGAVVDSNNRFSGITEEQIGAETKRLHDIQLALLSYVNDKTILIGHGLDNDLIALKLVHSYVVDTSLVFPHRLGPPHKRGLRTLAAEHLKLLIQDQETGHDSAEDAICSLKLMLFKTMDFGGFDIEALSNLINPPKEDGDDDTSDDDGCPSTGPMAAMTPGQIGPGPTSSKSKSKTTAPVDGANPKDIWQPYEIPELAEAQTAVVGLCDDRMEPDYKIWYKQSVTTEDMFLQMGNKTPATSSCDQLVVEISLPETRPADIVLDVKSTVLDLRTLKWKLVLPTPHPVDADSGRAQWDGAKQLLKVTLKLVRELDFVNF